MANYYRDPTASAAIGAVDKELNLMRKRANRIRDLHRQGRLTPRELTAAKRQFRGIYRRLLEEALR